MAQLKPRGGIRDEPRRRRMADPRAAHAVLQKLPNS
jgi:hypothetical protein